MAAKVFQELSEALVDNDALRQDLLAINRIYRFDFESGSFKVDCSLDPPVIAPVDADFKAACVIKATEDVMVAIAAGSLTAEGAFMQGKIRLQGPMDMALKVAGLLTQHAELRMKAKL